MTNLSGVVITFYNIIMCRRIHALETVGTALIMFAALCMIMDPSAKRVGEEVNMQVGLMSLTANFPGAVFWYLSKTL